MVALEATSGAGLIAEIIEHKKNSSRTGAAEAVDRLKARLSELAHIEKEGIPVTRVRKLAEGNPNLRPTTGTSVDVTAEWYFAPAGSVTLALFNKDLKNVGPSVQYKVRDSTGQAREYQNYMQPVTLDGVPMFLSGVRASPSDPFSYLRIPADDEHSVRDWMRLRAALHDPALRERAANAYAGRMSPGAGKGDGKSETVQSQLALSARKSLEIFAGDKAAGGYMSVSRFLEKVPQAEQEKAADIFMKILNGTLWELWQVARAKDGLAPAKADEAHARFLQLATNALSDSFFYGAPVYLQLDEYTQVKASVFQVTRSPGKAVVYVGCTLLVLGVFAMFYIRERRLWVWVRDDAGGAHALMAMSTQRKTMDFDNEFADLKEKLPQTA